MRLETSLVKNLCPKTLIVRLESLDLLSNSDSAVESKSTEEYQNQNIGRLSKCLHLNTLIIKLEPVVSEFQDILWETNEKSDVEILFKATRATNTSSNQDIVSKILVNNEPAFEKSANNQGTEGVVQETKNNYRKLRNRSVNLVHCEIELKNPPDQTTKEKSKPIDASLSNSASKNQSTTKKFQYICNFCQKTLQSYESLIRHTSKHTGEKRLACLLCDQTYSFVPGYVKPHGLTHDEKCLARKPFVCKICYKSFTNESLQNAHHKKYHSRIITKTKNLSRKKNKKNKNKKFMCNFCGFTRSCWNHLLIHMRTHTKEKPYICKYCNKYFTSRSVLKTHKTIHEARNKGHLCETCGKAYFQASDLQRHIKSAHQGKRVKCELCERTYADPSSLGLHVKFFHERYKPFKCHLCKFAATRNPDLQRHMKSHSAERSFVCKDCGKGFHYRRLLNVHISGFHKGEKPFVCEHKNCGKRFASKNHLKAHTTTHSTKTFLCQICGCVFAQQRGLTQHGMTHSKEKPHLCSVCGKGFTQKQNLIRHGLIHSGEQSHLCHKCGRAFSLEANLKRHIGSLWCKRSEKFKQKIKLC